MEIGKTIMHTLLKNNPKALQWYEDYVATTDAFAEQLKAVGESVKEGIPSVRQNLEEIDQS